MRSGTYLSQFLRSFLPSLTIVCSNEFISSKIYDKRDDFDFDLETFSFFFFFFLDGDIGVYVCPA